MAEDTGANNSSAVSIDVFMDHRSGVPAVGTQTQCQGICAGNGWTGGAWAPLSLLFQIV